jgi:hypothetical protein
MTTDQNNIVNMFQTTLSFLDQNNSVWSGTVAFADAVTRAKSAVSSVSAAAKAQESPTGGVTGDKAQARADLEEQLLVIADQLSALAAKGNDKDMGAKVEMTKSSLDKLTDNALDQAVQRVVALAEANVTALADFDIAPAETKALEQARSAYTEIQTSTRKAAVGRKAQTESLPQLIANARSIFRNEIDKMVTLKKKNNPVFYAGYFAARMIVNRAATMAKKPATPGSGPTPPAPSTSVPRD